MCSADHYGAPPPESLMANADIPTTPRDFSRVDHKRSIIAIAMISLLSACYWVMLPSIQSKIIPATPDGANGGWVLRPILAFHFGTVAVMTSVTFPVLTISLRKAWKRQDAALGSQYDPFA